MTMGKPSPFLPGLLILLALQIPAPALGKDSGTVTGTISLERAKVKYDGPKSSRFVVVSLDRAGQPPQTASPEPPVHMDQKGLVFIPHVLAVQLGQSVEFLNSDNDRHNVYFLHDETGETLDIGTWGPGVSVTHQFDTSGLFITLCTLHLEMAAYILVFPHPYFCLAEFDPQSSQAAFTIQGVPAGEYQVNIWHKKLKQKLGPKPLTVPPGATVVLDDVVTKKKYAR